MHGDNHKGELRGRLRTPGRDVGQWLSPRDRVEYIEGTDQATQHPTHHSEHRYRQIQVDTIFKIAFEHFM